MKVLLLNANRVGVGTYHRALNFGRLLAKRGHDVTLMAVARSERFRKLMRSEGERFRVIECPNWLDELLPWHASGVLDILLRIREIQTGGYDIVYAFEYQPNISFPVFLCKPFRRFKLLSDWCDWHAGASYHFGGRRWAHWVDRVFEEHIRHHADFVTTINRTLRTRALKIGIPPERLAIVGEGVDPKYIAPRDRADARRRLGIDLAGPIVATIRDSLRGADLLMAALAKTEDRRIKLLFIGSAPPALIERAARHGVQDRLILPGWVSDDDLPHYLAAADLFALPLEDTLANWGRWPHKLGDMLAAGRPIVVTLAGEFPELLSQRQCAVISAFDADAFARAMDDIVRSPENYAALVARGRQLVENELSWDHIAPQLDAVLQRVVAA